MHNIQNLQFSFPSLPQHLFWHSADKEYACQTKADGLHLASYGKQISLNFTSLFNSFPAEHFLLNTTATQVWLQLRISGKADSISIYRKSQWSEERILQHQDCNEGTLTLGPFPLEKGIERYSFSIETRQEITIHAGCWLVDANAQNKSVDVCITTFKKEHYVTANVNALLHYPPLKKQNYRITVVDNGSTLKREDFSASEQCQLISQANLGGTGGFMRGLMDARTKNSDYILFMDDDILLAPEMIYRAVAIAQIARPKKAFGGMMLHYTRKDKIHEQGGRLPWKINNFFQAINSDDQLVRTQKNEGTLQDSESKQNNQAGPAVYRETLRAQDKFAPLYAEGYPDFSGWWFYMAETKETPILPNFFFKWDDICSSLYLQQHGNSLTVFPTIFVWHEDFSIKRHLMMTDYLSMRNEIWTFAFLDIPAKQMQTAFRRTFMMIVRDILMYDYQRAKIRLQSLQDALRYREYLAPQFVTDGHGDYPVKLAREYMPPLQDIDNHIDTFYEKEKKRYPRGTFIKRLIRLSLGTLRMLMPWKKASLSNGKIPLLSMDNGNFPIIYPYQKYFLYNSDGNVGYYCEYSAKESRQLLWQTVKTLRQIKKAYPQIVAWMKTQTFDETYWHAIFQAKAEK